MKLQVFRTAAEAARAAAHVIALRLRTDPYTVLGLPTGRTSVRVYDELARLHEAGRADFSKAHTFNLDEFVGLSAADRGSFRTFMEKHLFRRVNLPCDQVHFLNGRAADLEKECLRFELAITDAGGIDVLLLGVGANGHIGFNEPAASLFARTHRARLRPETRRTNAARFGGRATAVPREALSMGMATILGARSIVLIATGRAKSRPVASLVTGRISPASPVSFLQLHPDVQVILDHAAASRLHLPESFAH